MLAGLVEPVTECRTVRVLFVATLLVVAVGVSALTAWRVWPEWRRYRTVHALIESVKVKDGLTFVDASPHGKGYLPDFDRIARIVGEVRSVGGAEDAVEELAKLLRDEDIGVRQYAAWFLESFGKQSKPAIPSLIESLRDEEFNFRRRAAFVLSSIGEDAVPSLLEALESDSDTVRYEAAFALEVLAKNEPELAARFNLK